MDMIEIFKAVILGIVEGVTEWLPISSTGHMILVDEFMQLNASDSFKEMFFVVIQLGAILAVVLLYFNKLNPFSLRKTSYERRETMAIWMKVLIGVIPAGVMGVLFDDFFDKYFYNYIVVSIMLILYGVLFIVVENRNRFKWSRVNEFSELSFKTALMIGIFQVLSLIPGTSRSGVTILGAILLGVTRPIAAEYSFFMSIPIMFGASLLKLMKFGLNFTQSELIILISGMVVAFLVSIISIKILMRYIRNNDFKAFGWYRIVLGILVLGYFALFR